MRCPNCGLDIPDRYGFCIMCGYRFQDHDEGCESGSDDDCPGYDVTEDSDDDYLEYEVVDDPGCDDGQDEDPVPCTVKPVSPALVAIMSIVSGAGHMYLGRMRLGLAILMAQIVIFFVGTYLMGIESVSALMARFSFIVIAFFLALFAIYDSYVSAGVYNEYLEFYGKKPW